MVRRHPGPLEEFGNSPGPLKEFGNSLGPLEELGNSPGPLEEFGNSSKWGPSQSIFPLFTFISVIVTVITLY